jgi:lysine 2,3-aminomutase
MKHHRTTLDEGIKLIRSVVMSGQISGRAKPMFVAMTDIGKITLYEGVIISRDLKSNRLLLQSDYSYESRLKWNPKWQKPDSVEIDNNGLMRV